jgi:hypothetical protein
MRIDVAYKDNDTTMRFTRLDLKRYAEVFGAGIFYYNLTQPRNLT